MGKRSKRKSGGGAGGPASAAPENEVGETVAPIDPARREELRAKLRAKMRGSNSSKQEAAKQMMEDPASALLRMGIDDPKILQAAPGMVKSIASRVKSGKAVTGEQGVQETLADVCGAIAGGAGPPPVESEESDDEEAPPPP